MAINLLIFLNSYTMKTTNSNCRRFVQFKKPFEATELFGEYNHEGYYVVYSCGEHFPLFAYVNNRWYENEEEHSSQSSKHKKQAHPYEITNKVDTAEMQRLIK